MKITAAAAAILTALLSREGHAQAPAAPAAASIPAGVVEALEKQVLYHPRKYTPAAVQSFTASGGKRLDYQTSQGRQTAWIITPKESTVPERLWIICGGNATLVLELAAFCRAQAFPKDAWLLVDYPGFGECAGQPSPQGFRENFKTCVPLAASQLKLETAKLPDYACVFGHSLGCAAALLAVQEFQLRAAVLCAPFTSTPEMAEQMFHMPKGLPLQHVFDNRTGLKCLQQCQGRAWIFHGDADRVIPVGMSRTMAAEFKDTVTLLTASGGSHNDIFRRQAKEISAAMAEARKLTPAAKPGTAAP